jgi:hypothetical protein
VASRMHVCADANFPRLPRLAKVVAYHNSLPGRMGLNCAHSLALVLITVLKSLERTGDVCDTSPPPRLRVIPHAQAAFGSAATFRACQS